MGLFEKQCLPRSAVQINRVLEQALMKKIKMPWEVLSTGEIRKKISFWKKRVCLVVEEDGGHMEHTLK